MNEFQKGVEHGRELERAAYAAMTREKCLEEVSALIDDYIQTTDGKARMPDMCAVENYLISNLK